MEKQRGMVFGFQKTATAVIKPDRQAGRRAGGWAGGQAGIHSFIHFECCIQILKFKNNFDSFRILYFPSSCAK
jgi:hypothetical protein